MATTPQICAGRSFGDFVCLCCVHESASISERQSFIQLSVGDLMGEVEIWNGFIISLPDKDRRAQGQSQFTHTLLATTGLMKFGRLKTRQEEQRGQYRYTKTTLGNKSRRIEFFNSAPALSPHERWMERKREKLHEIKFKPERTDKTCSHGKKWRREEREKEAKLSKWGRRKLYKEAERAKWRTKWLKRDEKGFHRHNKCQD